MCCIVDLQFFLVCFCLKCKCVHFIRANLITILCIVFIYFCVRDRGKIYGRNEGYISDEEEWCEGNAHRTNIFFRLYILN